MPPLAISHPQLLLSPSDSPSKAEAETGDEPVDAETQTEASQHVGSEAPACLFFLSLEHFSKMSIAQRNYETYDLYYGSNGFTVFLQGGIQFLADIG